MKKMVKIVRIANEGFDSDPYRSKYPHWGRFFDVTITDLEQSYLCIPESATQVYSDNLSGCFCHFYQYDGWQTRRGRGLSIRNGHKVNIAYLPEDEIVFVKNVKADLKRTFVTEIEKIRIHPETKESLTYSVPLDYGDQDWVRMPLFLAKKRSDEYLKTALSVEEQLSEIYLTPEQINRLRRKRKLNHIKDYLIVYLASLDSANLWYEWWNLCFRKQRK